MEDIAPAMPAEAALSPLAAFHRKLAISGSLASKKDLTPRRAERYRDVPNGRFKVLM